MSTPLITLVAPACGELKHNCPFVESMLAQRDPNWKAIIFHNGPNPEMKEWVESYKDNRLVYEESELNTGMWGTQNRQTALTYMVDTPYVIQTSVQDYWLQNAMAELNNVIAASQPDMITWQAINHLFRYGILTGEVAFGHCDWGQFCTKTEYAKKVGIQKMDQFTSDWHTIQGLVQSGLIKNAQKLDRILTIHN